MLHTYSVFQCKRRLCAGSSAILHAAEKLEFCFDHEHLALFLQLAILAVYLYYI